jgi:ABC-type cobalamin/Fe3+-siderophores transport system ATPase subunit
MYLTSIEIENLGPISNLSFKPLVDGENPKPLVIVGTNGSGKTTILSTLVSSLVAFKQQAFENVEVEAKKVFRMRGSKLERTSTRGSLSLVLN